MRSEMENTVAKQIKTTMEDSLPKIACDVNTTLTEDALGQNARTMEVSILLLYMNL